MTAQQILNYLAMEHISHSPSSRITRVFFLNDQMAEMHFLRVNQNANLISENKWLASTTDNSDQLIEFSGDDIKELRSGSAI
jgi:hypothetical protein